VEFFAVVFATVQACLAPDIILRVAVGIAQAALVPFTMLGIVLNTRSPEAAIMPVGAVVVVKAVVTHGFDRVSRNIRKCRK